MDKHHVSAVTNWKAEWHQAQLCFSKGWDVEGYERLSNARMYAREAALERICERQQREINRLNLIVSARSDHDRWERENANDAF